MPIKALQTRFEEDGVTKLLIGEPNEQSVTNLFRCCVVRLYMYLCSYSILMVYATSLHQVTF